jgi:hypothetical protein
LDHAVKLFDQHQGSNQQYNTYAPAQAALQSSDEDAVMPGRWMACRIVR